MKIFLKFSLYLIFISTAGELNAQLILFAELTGSPDVNTTGWTFAGDSKAGDTKGDPDTNKDEIILCNNEFGTSGACFFSSPLNLNICSFWIAEFDYRMYEGNSADGIAFWFLANPPTSYLIGGGCGIPPKPKGLMVVLDSYNNCNDAGSPCCNPKLEIRYGNGIGNYDECPAPAQPTKSNVPLIRSNNYNRCKVIYNSGKVDVYLNNVLQLSGFYQINFSGYLGFSASTGALKDLHSIKNVQIYTRAPLADAGPDKKICTGESVQLGTGSKPGYNYQWSPATGLNSAAISNPTVTLTNPTSTPQTHMYVLRVDTAGGTCVSEDTVFVTVTAKPWVYAGMDTSVCSDQLVQLGTPARPGYNYLWLPQAGLSAGNISNPVLKIPNLTGTPQTYIYRVRADSASVSCMSEDTVVVTINPFPMAKISGTGKLCAGDSIALSGSGGAFYQWTPNTFLDKDNVPAPVAKPLATIQYKLRTWDSYGCGESFDSITLTVSPLPATIGDNNKTVCPGEKVTLTAGGGSTYLWSTGATSQGIQFYASKDTIISVRAVSADGCIGQQETMTITKKPKPVSAFTPLLSKDDPLNVPFLNLSKGATAYLWHFGDGDSSDLFEPTHLYLYPGKYFITLQAFNPQGCSDTSRNVIRIGRHYLYIPNAFTPDDNGLNDVFEPKFVGIEELSCKIFNRWGEKIHEWTFPDGKFWDGTYLGKPCQEGVYFYVISGKSVAFELIERTGVVTLLR